MNYMTPTVSGNGSKSAEARETALREVLMPPLAARMKKEKVKLAQWCKAVGDEVEIGDLIAVIETNKAAIDIEAEYAGVLVSILVSEGTTAIEPGTPLAVLEVEVVAEAIAREVDANCAELAVADDPDVVGKARGDLSFAMATPLVQRIAGQRGIDLTNVKGSGAYGRILERDLDSARSSGASPITDHAAQYGETQFPEICAIVEVRLDAVLALRDRLNALSSQHVRSEAKGQPKGGATLDAALVRALATALTVLPQANARWMEGAIRLADNLSIAAASTTAEAGNPLVLSEPARRGILDLSTQLATGGGTTAEGQANPDGAVAMVRTGLSDSHSLMADIGTTRTMSLALGPMENRTIFSDGRQTVEQRANLTLCADRRIVDGPLAMELVGIVRMLLEDPALMTL